MSAKKKKENGSLQNSTSAEIEELKKSLDHEEISDAKEFVSTGSTLLDYAIANKRNGGVPVGFITELIGENQAGKTLIATQILASTQKKGGIAICIDTEHDMDKGFSYRVGLNWDGLIYKEYLETIEEVVAYIEKVVTTTRLKYKDKLVTTVWDSIAATRAKAELEKDFDPTQFVGLHARLMSAGLRKLRSMIKSERIALICTNQLRTKIGVSFGDPTTTAHGKAMSFYACVRVKLARVKKIEQGTRIIGAMCQAKVIKNKVGPGWRTADFPVMYDYGIDDARSVMEFLKDLKMITTKGGWHKMNFENEEYSFRSTEFRDLLKKNPNLHRWVLDEVEKHSVIIPTERPESLNIDLDSIMEVEQVLANQEGA